jgi:ribulose-5-phosphate 4-epimerase/fuculose-1-phosphate aldolase
MATPVTFDPAIVERFLRYARMVVARGYIHNTLGNMVVRAPHPDYPQHGVAYTKHAGVSLEEMGAENVVITEIPSPTILAGRGITSVGHNLSREILRLRPDLNAVIHVHDDATIAYFGAGGVNEVGVLALDLPFILGKPVTAVPAHMDVEADVGPVKDFVAGTNLVVLVGHGLTSMGRTISEAYHRLNSFTADVRRAIIAEQLAAIRGTRPAYRSATEIAEMHKFAEAIIYPKRADNVMQGQATDLAKKGAAE